MITVIKKEIKINKELLSKIEWACTFSKTTPKIKDETMRKFYYNECINSKVCKLL